MDGLVGRHVTKPRRLGRRGHLPGVFHEGRVGPEDAAGDEELVRPPCQLGRVAGIEREAVEAPRDLGHGRVAMVDGHAIVDAGASDVVPGRLGLFAVALVALDGHAEPAEGHRQHGTPRPHVEDPIARPEAGEPDEQADVAGDHRGARAIEHVEEVGARRPQEGEFLPEMALDRRRGLDRLGHLDDAEVGLDAFAWGDQELPVLASEKQAHWRSAIADARSPSAASRASRAASSSTPARSATIATSSSSKPPASTSPASPRGRCAGSPTTW